MLCQECQKETAVVRVIHYTNGQANEKHLCEACARKAGLAMGEELLHSFAASLLSGLMEMQVGAEQTVDQKSRRSVTCPVCGQSYRHLQQTGRLGCPECYPAFRQFLDPLLRRMHGSTVHRGKIPLRAGSAWQQQRHVADLRLALTNAVSEERFEDAARLRDELRELEGKGQE